MCPKTHVANAMEEVKSLLGSHQLRHGRRTLRSPQTSKQLISVVSFSHLLTRRILRHIKASKTTVRIFMYFMSLKKDTRNTTMLTVIPNFWTHSRATLFRSDDHKMSAFSETHKV